MKSRLSNLRLLLCTSAFARWPLTIRFLSEEVHRSWNLLPGWDDKSLSPATRVILDVSPAEPDKQVQLSGDEELPNSQASPTNRPRVSKWAPTGSSGIQALDITYRSLGIHHQKSMSVIELAGTSLQCGICLHNISSPQAVVCPHAFCEHVAHLTCLASVFLDREDSTNILPVKGYCPDCRSECNWGDIVKELSLRTRTNRDKSKKNSRRQRSGPTLESGCDDSCEEDEEESRISALDVADILEDQEGEAGVADEPSNAEFIGDDVVRYVSDMAGRVLRDQQGQLPDLVEETDDWDVEVI
jgi:structure-specific endonuclease subunit SLX1